MEKFKLFIKRLNIFEQKHNLAHWLMAGAVILFLLFSFLSLPDKKFGDYPIFNSPDETANYLFSQNFVRTGKFIYDDVFAVASAGYILPRSMQVVFNRVTPTAFIGLPLIYGTLSKIVGLNWMIFFTPIVMSVAILCLYWALWVNYNKKFAWLSIILIIINPAWLYSATRPMMTTGLFISFVILTLASYLLTLKYQRSVLYAFTGVFFGLALMVRISELVWLLPAALLLIYLTRKKVYWLGFVVSVICILPSLVVVGKYNYDHFASPVQFGYNNVAAEPNADFVKTALFPFGVNLVKSWEHLYNYTFVLFSFWTVVSLLALLFFVYSIIKAKGKEQFISLIIGLIIIGYLIVYYGSWTFFDNPNPTAITIGSSYVRYFLPVMLLAAPLIAFALTKIKNIKIFYIITAIILISLAGTSYNSVWFGKDEGVETVKTTLTEYKKVRDDILRLTTERSIIIAGRMDKAIYPFRRVYSGVTDWSVVAKYIYPRVPAYLLSKPLSQEEIINKNKELLSFGLELEDGVRLTDNFFLYQIIKKHE